MAFAHLTVQLRSSLVVAALRKLAYAIYRSVFRFKFRKILVEICDIFLIFAPKH